MIVESVNKITSGGAQLQGKKLEASVQGGVEVTDRSQQGTKVPGRAEGRESRQFLDLSPKVRHT